jgi:hypothetical protein
VKERTERCLMGEREEGIKDGARSKEEGKLDRK